MSHQAIQITAERYRRFEEALLPKGVNTNTSVLLPTTQHSPAFSAAPSQEALRAESREYGNQWGVHRRHLGGGVRAWSAQQQPEVSAFTQSSAGAPSAGSRSMLFDPLPRLGGGMTARSPIPQVSPPRPLKKPQYTSPPNVSPIQTVDADQLRGKVAQLISALDKVQAIAPPASLTSLAKFGSHTDTDIGTPDKPATVTCPRCAFSWSEGEGRGEGTPAHTTHAATPPSAGTREGSGDIARLSPRAPERGWGGVAKDVKGVKGVALVSPVRGGATGGNGGGGSRGGFDVISLKAPPRVVSPAASPALAIVVPTTPIKSSVSYLPATPLYRAAVSPVADMATSTCDADEAPLESAPFSHAREVERQDTSDTLRQALDDTRLTRQTSTASLNPADEQALLLSLIGRSVVMDQGGFSGFSVTPYQEVQGEEEVGAFARSDTADSPGQKLLTSEAPTSVGVDSRGFSLDLPPEDFRDPSSGDTCRSPSHGHETLQGAATEAEESIPFQHPKSPMEARGREMP